MTVNADKLKGRLSYVQAQRERNSQIELESVGSFGNVVKWYGTTDISGIRVKTGRPYVTLYKGGRTPQHVIDNILFSKALATEHAKDPFTLQNLLDLPCYSMLVTPEGETEQVPMLVIGKKAEPREDIAGVAELFKNWKPEDSAAVAGKP